MMTLKPFRDYSEHEVVNLFALNEGSGNKGQIVKLVTFDPDNHSNYGAKLAGTPDYAWSSDYIVNARVSLAASGQRAFGMMLYDTRVNLPYLNMPANMADPVRLAEQQVVPSGRAVPIAQRGMFEVGGFSGVPGPGSGAYVSNLEAGAVQVGLPGVAGQIGTWLSSSGVDGHAILKLHVM